MNRTTRTLPSIAPPLFDVVVFDLDGTLVATDRFWIQAARTGARRAFEQLGLQRAIPSGAEWMSVVGQPLETGFERLFPDLDTAARRVVLEACTEEEQRLLHAGGAATMPGTEETLRALRRAGVRIGVASNCSQAYLDAVLDQLELRALVDEPRCLDTPGIGSKADMIEDLLETFGTRSAIMVGDRAGDRDAAWENGIPHVHCAFGFAAAGERVEAEACIEDLGALRECLARRRTWIEDELRDLGLCGPGGPARRARVIGIEGRPLAGKGLFARDAASVLREHGVAVRVASLEDFRHPEDGPGEQELVERRYDLGRLCADLLRPSGRDPAATGGVLLLEGPFLRHPRIAPHLDRLVSLALPEELSLRRAAGRDGRRDGPRALETLRLVDLPAHDAFDAAYPPAERGARVLDATSPLGTVPRPSAASPRQATRPAGG